MADLLDDIGAGRIAPLYFLCGEPYPRDRVLWALRQAVLGADAGGAAAAFNLDAFEGKDATAIRVISAARTLPMLGIRRLVQVRDAHLIATEELNRMLPYVQDPAPSTCLIFIADKADLRLKFFNAFKRHGVVQRFDPLKERQVPAWLAAEARRLRIALAPGTAESISEAVGTDMGQLVSALERLSLYVGEGRAITPDDADDVLAQTRQRSIFELTNAVGRGDRREALLVLRQMLSAREPGIRIVAMLARHLRHLWLARELAAGGQPSATIANRLGIHPFFVKDVLGQARRFDAAALQRMHQALWRTDRALKSSRLADATVLDQLVLDLCPS